VIALWLACADPLDATEQDALLVELPAPRLLRRASLDLRGVLPSVDELDAVEAEPERLDAYLEAYLDDPLVEERLVRLFQEHLQTLIDTFEVRHYDYGLADADEYAFERAVGEEPLRVLARVFVDDLPWPTVVTADWTMANEVLAGVWPLDYPDGATGWRAAQYTDGRPAAGVLASNGLWWRYVTNPSNMNRGRAAAISRLLLCSDILSRPVSLQDAVSLADDATDALRNNPSCVACHASIEPLAATLFGFYWFTQYNQAEMTRYHPERETLGTSERYLGVEPEYFGEPLRGLVDLGGAVAGDPRFDTCAVETAAKLLWRRDVDGVADFETLEALRLGFSTSGRSMKSLFRALLDTPGYRAGGVVDEADDATVEREATLRLQSPDQLASSVEAVTGFRWTWEGFDQLDEDETGFRVLTGGVDGELVTAPQREPGLTWALVVQRLAEGAADNAVRESELIELDGELGDQLEALHWRLYAERPEALWTESIAELWSQAEALEGSEAAWTTVLTVMLRDPRFVSR